MLGTLCRLIVASTIPLVAASCHGPNGPQSATDIQMQKMDQAVASYGSYFTYMTDNALLSDLSLGDIHFIPHTSEISGIDVQTGTSPANGEPCALAVFYVDGGFQPQLWYYTVDHDGAEFDAVAAPPNLMDRLYGDDWIAAWFAILDEEWALADKPDEEFIVAQREVGDDTARARTGGRGPGANPSGPSTPSDPSRPSAPGGPGRRPKKPKRSAPGKG